MGCIARLGCLIVLVLAAAGGWVTRNLWLPEKYRAHSVASTSVNGWEPLTPTGAERARVALAKLNESGGQAFETVSASDLASYVFRQLSPSIAKSADSVATSVSGDQVTMRATVRTADLRSTGALGSMASLLGDRERVQLTGTFRVVHPGLAEFDVRDVRVRDLPLPSGMIPALIRRVGGPRPAGLAENGLPLPIPRSIGDIRVANGKVTLYKSVQ